MLFAMLLLLSREIQDKRMPACHAADGLRLYLFSRHVVITMLRHCFLRITLMIAAALRRFDKRLRRHAARHFDVSSCHARYALRCCHDAAYVIYAGALFDYAAAMLFTPPCHAR